jgi:hypothetical protein
LAGGTGDKYDLYTRVGMDSNDFQKGIEDINRSLRGIKSEFKVTKETTKSFGNSFDALKDKSEFLSAHLVQTRKKAELLQKQIEKASVKYGENSKQTEKLGKQLNDAKAEELRLERQIKETNEQIAKQSTAFGRLEAKVSASADKLKAVGSAMKSVGSGMMLSLTAPLLAAGIASTKLAMDTGETENLYTVSVGNMKDSFDTFVASMQDGLGLNKYSVQEFAATFNTMFDSMKFGEESSFELSKGLTQLAYDMSSFYNMDPDEAFNKLQAGITGEAEGLKRLGIMIDEATIKSYAYQNGIAEEGTALTENQKVLARYAAIMDQTGKAQGDLANTIDSPTNQMRIQMESIKELGAEFGNVLLPAVADMLKPIKNLTDWLKGLDDGQKKLVVGVGIFAAALGPVIMMAGQLVIVLPAIITAVGLLKLKAGKLAAGLKFLATNPMAITVAAMTAIVIISKKIYDNWEHFAPLADATWATIADAVHIGGGRINVTFQALKVGFAKLLDFWLGGWLEFYGNLASMGKDLPIIGGAFEFASEKMNGMADGLERFSQNAQDDLSTAMKSLAESQKSFSENAGKMGDAAKELAGKMKDHFAGGVKDAADEAKEKGVPAYTDTGEALALALAEGIQSGNGAVKEASVNLVDSFKDSVNDLKDALVTALKLRIQESYDLEKENLENEVQALESWKDESIDRIKSVYDVRMDALEDQKDAAIDALDREKDRLDDWKDASIKAIESVRDAKLNALQDQIDALDEQEKDEGRAASFDEEQEQIDQLKLLIEYESDEGNLKTMQAELDKVLQAREVRLHKEAIEDKKASLKDEMEAVKEASDAEKEVVEERYEHQSEILDQRIEDKERFYETQAELMELAEESELESINSLYESSKETLDQQQLDQDAFYAKKLDDAAINAEAEKLIIDQNQVEILELLKGYGDGYQEVGKTLGERLVDGFSPQADKIASMINTIQSKLNAAQGKVDALKSNASSPSNITNNTTNNDSSKNISNNFTVNSGSNSDEMPRTIEGLSRRLSFEMAL